MRSSRTGQRPGPTRANSHQPQKRADQVRRFQNRQRDQQGLPHDCDSATCALGAAIAAGGTLEECILAEMAKHRSIAGYGRPVTNGDERIPHILALARELGLDKGEHLKLAFEVDAWLRGSRWQKTINYGAVVTALAADIGFTPHEFYLFMFPTFLAGMTPCFLEALERPEGALYALPCTAIHYEGPPPRVWPTAAT